MKLGMLIGGLAAAVAAYIAQPYRLVYIHGNSMSPTFRSGEIVLATRDVSDLREDDVVVFRRSGQTAMKRVAVLPGGPLSRMETQADVEYGVEYTFAHPTVSGYLKQHRVSRVALPQRKLFVVGDNSMESQDSRNYGPIEVETVTLKIIDPRVERRDCELAERGYANTNAFVRTLPAQEKVAATNPSEG